MVDWVVVSVVMVGTVEGRDEGMAEGEALGLVTTPSLVGARVTGARDGIVDTTGEVVGAEVTGEAEGVSNKRRRR